MSAVLSLSTNAADRVAICGLDAGLALEPGGLVLALQLARANWTEAIVSGLDRPLMSQWERLRLRITAMHRFSPEAVSLSSLAVDGAGEGERANPLSERWPRSSARIFLYELWWRR